MLGVLERPKIFVLEVTRGTPKNITGVRNVNVLVINEN